MPINDGLRGARMALEADEIVLAAQALQGVAADAGLMHGSTWLAAALGATHIGGRRASARGFRTLVTAGEPLARRQLAARGIELADPELVTAALETSRAHALDPFEPEERASLLALSGQDTAETWASLEAVPALLDALAAVSAAPTNTRARHTAGTFEARAMTSIGRLLAAGIQGAPIDDALESISTPRPASAAGVALDAAVRSVRLAEVATAIEEFPVQGDEAAQKFVASALLAERAGDREAAKNAWKEALAAGVPSAGLLRAAAGLDPSIDVAAELLRTADAMTDGPASAILRLESLARAAPDDDAVV